MHPVPQEMAVSALPSLAPYVFCIHIGVADPQ